MSDMINHPPHYEKHTIVIEPITILEKLPFTVGNVFKYIIRAKDKGNELEDLKKALWYLDRSFKNRMFDLEENMYLVVFCFSDNEILSYFANRYPFDPCAAWEDLERELKQRIHVLEGANNDR